MIRTLAGILGLAIDAATCRTRIEGLERDARMWRLCAQEMRLKLDDARGDRDRIQRLYAGACEHLRILAREPLRAELASSQAAHVATLRQAIGERDSARTSLDARVRELDGAIATIATMRAEVEPLRKAVTAARDYLAIRVDRRTLDDRARVMAALDACPPKVP